MVAKIVVDIEPLYYTHLQIQKAEKPNGTRYRQGRDLTEKPPDAGSAIGVGSERALRYFVWVVDINGPRTSKNGFQLGLAD